MFFARVDALKPLLSLGLTDDDFDIEAGQVDGTIAHAIERCFSVSMCSVKNHLVNTSSEIESHEEYVYARIG